MLFEQVVLVKGSLTEFILQPCDHTEEYVGWAVRWFVGVQLDPLCL